MGALALATACHGAAPNETPAPERAEPPQRGDAASARAVDRDDQLSIYSVLLRRFFRPSGGQARWIDPRPLTDVRDAHADSVATAEVEWADAIRELTGLAHVCVLGVDEDDCHGRRGTLLRFSPAYATAPTEARVFVRIVANYDDRGPLLVDMDRWEMAFTMARDGRAWRIAEKRMVRTR